MALTSPQGLSAGTMDREVVIQTATVVQDAGTGEEILTWTIGPIAVWAEWRPASGWERFVSAQRLGSQEAGMFRIHDVSPRPTPARSRVVFNSTTYDVQSVVEIGRGEGLELRVVARPD